jgi:hypothetical protein
MTAERICGDKMERKDIHLYLHFFIKEKIQKLLGKKNEMQQENSRVN